MSPDEIITAAMLLGAEFGVAAWVSGRDIMWFCHIGDGAPHTNSYITKADAAREFLRQRGFELNFNGELQKI